MRKGYTGLLAAALIGAILTGCAGASGSDGHGAGSQEEQPLKEITFVLDWTPNTTIQGYMWPGKKDILGMRALR